MWHLLLALRTSRTACTVLPNPRSHPQAQPIDPDLTAKLLGRGVAVSPVVTVEPRRRKFHKAITLSMPAPRAHSQGMINQYSGNAPTLRLLCSITGTYANVPGAFGSLLSLLLPPTYLLLSTVSLSLCSSVSVPPYHYTTKNYYYLLSPKPTAHCFAPFLCYIKEVKINNNNRKKNTSVLLVLFCFVSSNQQRTTR